MNARRSWKSRSLSTNDRTAVKGMKLIDDEGLTGADRISYTLLVVLGENKVARKPIKLFKSKFRLIDHVNKFALIKIRASQLTGAYVAPSKICYSEWVSNLKTFYSYNAGNVSDQCFKD